MNLKLYSAHLTHRRNDPSNLDPIVVAVVAITIEEVIDTIRRYYSEYAIHKLVLEKQDYVTTARPKMIKPDLPLS